MFQQLPFANDADRLNREGTLVEKGNSNKRDAARVIFGAVGVCAILLFLLWNPLVLRMRFWNAKIVVRSLSMDAALLVMGVGLIQLRRWAALLASAVAAYITVDFATRGGGLGVPLTLGLLTSLPLTVIFWGELVWGNKGRDRLVMLASLLVSTLIHYVAFALR